MTEKQKNTAHRQPKKARTGRARTKPRLELTSRDHDILTLTGLCGYVSSDQISREFFPSPDRARRRLRALYDADYLSFVIWRANQANLIRLSQNGWRYITAKSPQMSQRLRRPGVIREENISIHLLLVDVRLYAAAFGEHHGTPLSGWRSPDTAYYRNLELERYRVRPEAVAEFAFPCGPAVIAVAVVEPMRRPSTRFARQLSGYRDAIRDETLAGLWLVVEPFGPFASALADAELGAFTRLLSYRELVARPVQDKGAVNPNSPEGAKLTKPDLANSVAVAGSYEPGPRHG